MKFIDNFSETHLLFGYDVDFIILNDNGNLNSKDTVFIKMKLPVFKHCYMDYKFQNFLGLLLTPLEQTIKHIQNLNGITDLYSLFVGIIVTSVFNSYYASIIQYSMNILISDFNIKQGIMYINDIVLTKELFERIVDIILVATQHKKMYELTIKDATLQAMEDKISKIKKQNKNKTNQNIAETNFTNSYMILIYEFGFRPEEILNMTMYAISTVLKYTGKSINYKVSLIGAGNGLAKKIHFITDKGK